MAQKISKKVIACILVLAFVLQSIPLMLFMVSGAGGPGGSAADPSGFLARGEIFPGQRYGGL